MRRTTAASFVPAARRRISDGVSYSREIVPVIAVSLNRATTDGSCRFEPFQITLESTQRPVGISPPGTSQPRYGRWSCQHLMPAVGVDANGHNDSDRDDASYLDASDFNGWLRQQSPEHGTGCCGS